VSTSLNKYAILEEMSYPKTITLESAKLNKLLVEKADLVMDGRAVSEEIEAKEIEMEDVDKEIQEVEKTVDTEDLKVKAQGITDRFNAVMTEMEDMKKETFERMKAVVGVDLPAKYEAIKKEKEELETKRNKIGLRIQKFNDKIIPIGQKLMKPFIEDIFDDYDTLRLENGEIVASIFNHLDDAEKRLREQHKKPIGN